MQCVNQQNMAGMDTCHHWEGNPNVWCDENVQIDQIQPDKFRYDQYRYQLYAQPSSGRGLGGKGGAAGRKATVTWQGGLEGSEPPAYLPQQKLYVPPTTDVRALQQTMFVPMLPTKPGGEKDVTFPMTPRTMGQPDVTSACCVPVIPCQPGFKNLTESILPNAAQICQGCEPEQPCPFLTHTGRHPPPSNRQAYPHVGLPDTFPAMAAGAVQGLQQAMGFQGGAKVGVPSVPQVHIPHNTGAMPAAGGSDPCAVFPDPCLSTNYDGYDPNVPNVTSAKTFNKSERNKRETYQAQETPEERIQRLRTMFGAYGASLEAHPSCRRPFYQKDNIKIQGNGFQWEYPKHENRLCYKLERNQK